MRILVSGAGGFIGRHVTALAVSQGLSVHTIGTGAPGKEPPGGQHHVITAVDGATEIRSALEQARPDVILHLAGATLTQLPIDMYRVNAVYAQTILDAAVQVCPGARVVLAGSAAEYGPVPALERVHEAVECQPTTLYGISKLAQTLQGRAVNTQKLRVVTGRIFNCVGPGMPTSLALGSFVRQVAAMPSEGGQLVVGNLDSIRDFIMVDRVAAVLLQLGMAEAGAGEIFNIASGIGQNLTDVVNALCEISPCPVQLQRNDHIQGNSTMRRFVGDPTKIEALGIHIEPACFRDLLPIMLEAAKQ